MQAYHKGAVPPWTSSPCLSEENGHLLRNGKLEKKLLKMGGPSVAQIKISPDEKREKL